MGVRFATCAVAAAVLTACGSGGNSAGGTVTVTVPPSPATSPSTSSGATTAGTTPSSTPSSSATARTTLGGTCDSLLPDYPVYQALGIANLAGQDAFVVGVPDKTIGRLATINCRYGVTGTGAAARAKVEIGVSLYSTPAQAQARIGATADDYGLHGATPTDTTVGAAKGVRLTGGTGTGYDVPLLAVSADQRTVAVSVDPSVSSSPDAATKLAALALRRTAG